MEKRESPHMAYLGKGCTMSATAKENKRFESSRSEKQISAKKSATTDGCSDSWTTDDGEVLDLSDREDFWQSATFSKSRSFSEFLEEAKQLQAEALRSAK